VVRAADQAGLQVELLCSNHLLHSSSRRSRSSRRSPTAIIQPIISHTKTTVFPAPFPLCSSR
jgi:hypothetical protein